MTYARKNAAAFNRHICILTHIKDQAFALDDNKKRYYPIATYREVAGGQAWSRKGQAMLSVWRPQVRDLEIDGRVFNPDDTLVEIQKAKPKGIGKTGIVKFYYKPSEHIYYDNAGHAPSLDASEQVKTTKYSEDDSVYKDWYNPEKDDEDNYPKEEEAPF